MTFVTSTANSILWGKEQTESTESKTCPWRQNQPHQRRFSCRSRQEMSHKTNDRGINSIRLKQAVQKTTLYTGQQ